MDAAERGAFRVSYAARQAGTTRYDGPQGAEVSTFVYFITQSVLVSSNLSQTALNSIPTSLRDFFQRVHALPRSRSSQGADLIGWVPSFRSAAIEAGHAMTPWEVCGKCLKLVIYSRVLDSMLCELTA